MFLCVCFTDISSFCFTISLCARAYMYSVVLQPAVVYIYRGENSRAVKCSRTNNSAQRIHIRDKHNHGWHTASDGPKNLLFSFLLLLPHKTAYIVPEPSRLKQRFAVSKRNGDEVIINIVLVYCDKNTEFCTIVFSNCPYAFPVISSFLNSDIFKGRPNGFEPHDTKKKINKSTI